MAEGAELRRRHRNTSAQVKHDETLHQRARLEDDLPYIVLAQAASLHRAHNHIGRHVRRRRSPRPEVLRILARALALRKKHQLKQPRVVEGMVKKDIDYLQ